MKIIFDDCTDEDSCRAFIERIEEEGKKDQEHSEEQWFDQNGNTVTAEYVQQSIDED